VEYRNAGAMMIIFQTMVQEDWTVVMYNLWSTPLSLFLFLSLSLSLSLEFVCELT